MPLAMVVGHVVGNTPLGAASGHLTASRAGRGYRRGYRRYDVRKCRYNSIDYGECKRLLGPVPATNDMELDTPPSRAAFSFVATCRSDRARRRAPRPSPPLLADQPHKRVPMAAVTRAVRAMRCAGAVPHPHSHLRQAIAHASGPARRAHLGLSIELHFSPTTPVDMSEGDREAARDGDCGDRACPGPDACL